jgi:hypothetical protein
LPDGECHAGRAHQAWRQRSGESGENWFGTSAASSFQKLEVAELRVAERFAEDKVFNKP